MLEPQEEDIVEQQTFDRNMRPDNFDSFIGQVDFIERARIAIIAAKERDEPLGHTLLTSPPGLGKTSLSRAIANEYNGQFIEINASGLSKPSDLASIFAKIDKNDIVFIDECHQIPKTLQTMLLSCIEDFKLTIRLADKQVVNINIKPFCMICATTNLSKLNQPFRDRFDIQYVLQPYSNDELFIIISSNIKKLGLTIESKELVYDIANRSRGIPRIANRILIAKGFVEAHGGTITAENRTEGGAAFTIRLPLGEPPRVVEDTE